MPYISDKNKRRETVHYTGPENSGELNYMFTLLIIQYLESNGLSYQTCNDIVGFLDKLQVKIQHRYTYPYKNIQKHEFFESFKVLINQYIEKYEDDPEQTADDIVGALDNCKDEFRRRVQHPYEDTKIKDNGDVYPDIFTTPVMYEMSSKYKDKEKK